MSEKIDAGVPQKCQVHECGIESDHKTCACVVCGETFPNSEWHDAGVPSSPSPLEKEMARFQPPPEHVSKEELIGSLRYWVARAKVAEAKVQNVEPSTPPKPSPTVDFVECNSCGFPIERAETKPVCANCVKENRPCDAQHGAPPKPSAHTPLRITLEFEQELDGRWIAEFHHSPGCLVYGTTISEAALKACALLAEVEGEEDHAQ